MSKFCNKFANQDAYLAAKAGLPLPNVCYIDEGKEVKYNPLWAFDPKYLFSDGTVDKKLVSGKTPVGIEVIPAGHMADGKTRYMSLKNMSLLDPENGTTAVGNDSDDNPGAGIRWGNTNAEVTEHASEAILPYMDFEELKKGKYEYVGIQEGGSYFSSDVYASIIDKYTEESEEGYLYYPGLKGVYARVDSDAGGDPDWEPVVYPYLASGEKNPDYHHINLFGKEDTTSILSNQGLHWTDEMDFAARNDVSGGQNFPAANTCRLFNPGIGAGQWYLPSAGELGYMWANILKINKKLKAAGNAAVCVGIGNSSEFSPGSFGGGLWSSSEYSSYIAWRLDTYGGNLSSNGKVDSGTGFRVRAFFAI